MDSETLWTFVDALPRAPHEDVLNTVSCRPSQERPAYVFRQDDVAKKILTDLETLLKMMFDMLLLSPDDEVHLSVQRNSFWKPFRANQSQALMQCCCLYVCCVYNVWYWCWCWWWLLDFQDDFVIFMVQGRSSFSKFDSSIIDLFSYRPYLVPFSIDSIDSEQCAVMLGATVATPSWGLWTIELCCDVSAISTQLSSMVWYTF